MITKEYDPKDYLPLDYYPWPNLINSNVEQMGIDMDNWIDKDYIYLSEKSRAKYKRMKLHYSTARMCPTASYERMVFCNRFMLYYVVLDDQLEFLTLEEINPMLERMIEILKGVPPKPEENALYHHVGLLREEALAIMPPVWLERFTEGLYRCFTYGIQAETPYKVSKSVPPLDYFMVFREYSVNMLPYLYWADIEVDFVLPKLIEENPVIQRLRALTDRIIAWQNDIHSLAKELVMDTEKLNLVIVLQHTRNLSLEEALTETMHIHDEDLSEFVALHENLPNFGIHQQKVYDYVKVMGMMIQGVNTFYIKDTARYSPDGFAWPERN